MKFKLLAVAALVAASGAANAAIDTAGNGELFFNIWDTNGSYTRSLETTIDAFQTSLAATGGLNLSWTADAAYTSFLAGVSNVSALKWNIVASDTSGANRLLTTYTAPEATTTLANNLARIATGNTQQFAIAVNGFLAGADSVSVGSTSNAFAGKALFKDTAGGQLNFSNAGALSNNSYASGLGFMRVDAAATGTAKSVYNEYYDTGAVAVNAWVDGNNTIHISAVPEPETYAMLLAGLGMIGAVARRRRNKSSI